jgi:hypothetical protein
MHSSRSDLRTELQEIEARAAAIKAERTPRSPSVIAWDIKTVVIPTGARRNSEDCTTLVMAYTRKACAPLLVLRKELEEAEELDRLERRAAKLRKQLADAQVVASRDPAATSFELLLGTLLTKAGVTQIDGTVGFPGLMILLLEMVSALGFYIVGEMYGVLWPAVVTLHMAHLSRRARDQVEGAPDTPENAVGEFKTLPIGRRHERVAGANGDNTEPAQGKVSEVVSSRSPNIIKGRFGSNPEGKFKPAQTRVTSGAIGCPTTLALKRAAAACFSPSTSEAHLCRASIRMRILGRPHGQVRIRRGQVSRPPRHSAGCFARRWKRQWQED